MIWVAKLLRHYICECKLTTHILTKRTTYCKLSTCRHERCYQQGCSAIKTMLLYNHKHAVANCTIFSCVEIAIIIIYTKLKLK